MSTDRTKILQYSEAKQLIQEADIVLFRAKKFPSIGWFLTGVTGGIHSHVGIASVSHSEPSLIEMREFKGGREVGLEMQITKEGVDIYRLSPNVTSWDGENWNTKHFNEDIAKCITRTARSITGKEYGWANIWGIYQAYMPGYRLIFRGKNGDDYISQAYVCSTVASYAPRLCYADPVPNLSDRKTTPADIASSALLHYMFTIIPD